MPSAKICIIIPVILCRAQAQPSLPGSKAGRINTSAVQVSKLVSERLQAEKPLMTEQQIQRMKKRIPTLLATMIGSALYSQQGLTADLASQCLLGVPSYNRRT